MTIGNKEESSLTREEACYEELVALFRRRTRYASSFGENQQLVKLEDVQRIAQECPGAFRLQDRSEKTLLHHACYSEGVTVEILALLYKMNPDAINHTVETGSSRRRTAVECMTYNKNAQHDAFSFLMEKSKDMRDPYDFFLELRFLCKNERFPVTASKLRSVVEACPDAVSIQPNEQSGLFDSDGPLQILCCNKTATLEAVEYLYGAYPDAIALGDFGFPLHKACWHGLPLEIIHFLTHQYPEAVRVDRHGTALHKYLKGCEIQWSSDGEGESVMERSGVDIEVVRRFIEIFPQALEVSDHEGTPLHTLVRMLSLFSDSMELMELTIEMARISPAALQVQGGNTIPLLHCICRKKGIPVSFVKALVDIDPTILNLPSSGGELPIHVVCRVLCYSESIELLKYIIDRAPETVMVTEAHVGNLPIHALLSSLGDISLEALQSLVECNNSMLRVANSSGDLPLHMACRQFGSPTFHNVQYLVTKDPESTKMRNSAGCTPLDVAISNEYQDTVDLLLEKDSDIAVQITTGGGSSFHRACRNGSLETIKKIHTIRPNLLQTVNDQQQLPLLFAIRGEQDLHIICFLLQEYPTSILLKDIDGFLPLHHACLVEDPDIDLVKVLFKCYPPAIHTPTNDGRLPIQIICGKPIRWRALEVLKFLACQLPYSLSLPDAEGRYLLHRFCQEVENTMHIEQFRDTFAKLHELNPNAIRLESEDFGLPIHCACKNHSFDLEMLKQIIALYPESIDHNHKTLGFPLHSSIGRHDVFEFLLEKRYDSYAERHGRFFLHALLEDEAIDRKEDLANALFSLLVYKDDPVYGRSFKRKDTEIERSKDRQGRLPLHLAVSVPGGLDEDFVDKLIGMYPGALDDKDHQGMLPLHHAFQNCAPVDILYMLTSHSSDAMTLPDNNHCLPFHHGCQYHRKQSFMDFINNKEYLEHFGVYIKDLCKERASNGELPLHKACLGGNLDCISTLVEAHPLALRTRNNAGMLPVFLLCQEVGKNKDDFEAAEERYIGAIFDLLKENPEAILFRAHA